MTVTAFSSLEEFELDSTTHDGNGVYHQDEWSSGGRRGGENGSKMKSPTRCSPLYGDPSQAMQDKRFLQVLRRSAARALWVLSSGQPWPPSAIAEVSSSALLDRAATTRMINHYRLVSRFTGVCYHHRSVKQGEKIPVPGFGLASYVQLSCPLSARLFSRNSTSTFRFPQWLQSKPRCWPTGLCVYFISDCACQPRLSCIQNLVVNQTIRHVFANI